MKPKLVLHVCCAPDEAYVVHTLNADHELACFFCNPNISPFEEYAIRLKEARKVADHYGVFLLPTITCPSCGKNR